MYMFIYMLFDNFGAPFFGPGWGLWKPRWRHLVAICAPSWGLLRASWPRYHLPNLLINS